MKKVMVYTGDAVATPRARAFCKFGERKNLVVMLAQYDNRTDFTDATTAAMEEGWESVVIDHVETVTPAKLSISRDLMSAYERALQQGRAVVALER